MLKTLIRCAAVACALVPALATGEPIKLKLSFVSSDRAHAYQAGIKPFVDAVNADAKGMLEVQVHFSGALGRSPQQDMLLIDGTADIAFVVPAYTSDRFYDDTIMQLPGLFRDLREATLVYTRMIAAGALRGYEDFFAIGAFGSEPESIHTRQPAASLADLQGRKIRVNNPIVGVALEKLGMAPVLMPVNFASDAISSGSIDGAAAPPSILSEFGVGRVVSNHYMLRTSSAPLTLLMRRKRFETLPAEARSIIRKYSGEWSAARFADIMGRVNATVLEQLKADSRRKVVFPSPADLERAQAAFAAVLADAVNKDARNRELLARVQRELADLRAD